MRRLRELGVRQVIDLRWPEELVRAPNVFRDVPDVRYRSIPLLRDDPTPHAGLGGMYRYVFDRRAPELAVIVRALLDDGGLPVIIGCAAGKDRTGVTIALLLDLVDTPADVIVADYARSAHHFRTPVSRVDPDDWRHPPLEVHSPPELMASALEHLARYHGGGRALMRGEGVSDGELARLVDLLTEPDPG